MQGLRKCTRGHFYCVPFIVCLRMLNLACIVWEWARKASKAPIWTVAYGTFLCAMGWISSHLFSAVFPASAIYFTVFFSFFLNGRVFFPPAHSTQPPPPPEGRNLLQKKIYEQLVLTILRPRGGDRGPGALLFPKHFPVMQSLVIISFCFLYISKNFPILAAIY